MGKIEMHERAGLPELRMRRGACYYYARVNSASEESIRAAAAYFGASVEEIEDVLDDYGYPTFEAPEAA